MATRTRWGRSLLGLLLTVIVTAGCGAPESDTAALTRYDRIDELIAAVSAQQRVDRTARFSLRGELTGAGEVAVRFTGTGVLQIVDDDVALQFTQVVTRAGAEPEESGFVVLPDGVYLRMPGADPAKPWVHVDPDDATPESQQQIALADQVVERADPTGTMSRYSGATQITEAADDVVGGAPAVRYTIVTDLARAAEQTTDPTLRAQLEQQVSSGLTQVTSTLWVDAAHRPLRSAARQELPGLGELAVTSTYRDWGQAAEIQPPPAGLVQ